MSFNLKTAIGAIAPTLATMLGGPLAGTAVSALTSAFGMQSSGDNAKDTSAITKVVQDGKMTPEIIAAVRAADQKHSEIIGQQGIDLAKLNASHEEAMESTAAGDRNSARQREIALKDKVPARLAYMIIGGFFVTAIAQVVTFVVWPEQIGKIPPQAWVIIGNISGYLAAEAKAAASYYFGSTTGSKQKDATIDKALNN